MQKTYEGVDEIALIEDWIRRKYRMTPREGLFGEEKDLAAAYRRLARAGFRSGEIIRVLKRFAKNPELLDSFEPPEEPLEEELVPSGPRANARSSTTRPPIRCSWIIRSSASGPAE